MKDHQSECLLYRLQYVPTKGYGLVATRDIEPSELIVSEKPLLKVPLTDQGDLVGHFDFDKKEFVSPSLVIALNQLADNELFKFFSLADSCSRLIALEHGFESNESTRGLKTNYGIIKTNSFVVTFPEYAASSFLALFPNIARLNHSCQPNCNHYWSGSHFNVRAIKPVRRGEELSISYMSPLQRSDFHTRDSRRKILKEEFGFHCLCNLCSDPEIDLSKNDADRTQLLEIEQKWVHLGQDPQGALELAEKQLDLARRVNLQAGLLAYIALHCVEAASLVVSSQESSEQYQKGLHYAAVAKECGQIAYGATSDEAKVFDSICSHWNLTDRQDLFSAIQGCISKLRDIV